MAKVTIEQREMDFEEFQKRYGAKHPRAVENCEKYQEAELVVFQQGGVPMMVFVKTLVTDGDTQMCNLTNVISSTLELDVALMRRYKDADARKLNLVIFDLPRAITVAGCRPSILRFTKQAEDEVPVERYQPYTITQDTFEMHGGFDWLDTIAPKIWHGQEVHLVCYNPTLEHNIARALVERYEFRQHRAVYIP